MKPSIIITLLLGITSYSFGQILNGNFEEWNTTTWETINHANTSAGELVANGLNSNVIKTTDSQNGNSAIRLESVAIDEDESTFAFALFGQFGDEGPISGFPFTQTPQTIQGYYKSNLADGDTSIMVIALWENDEVISMSTFSFFGVQNTYTLFSFPLNIPINAQLDSITLGITSANPFSGAIPTPGSWIQFDNFSFGGVGITQNMPNADFEEWSDISVEEPSDWFTFGVALQAYLGVNYVEKYTPAYKGEAALKITTTIIDDGQIGFVTNGFPGVFNDFEGGAPFTNITDTLCGYYIYQPAVGSDDSAFVSMAFSSMGNIFMYAPKLLSATEQYTYFEIPFTLFQAPDMVRIDISSSKWEENPVFNGSTLIIDELQFKSAPLATNIKKTIQNPFKSWVYPNPAQSFINIEMDSKINNAQLMLYDFQGKQIWNKSFTESSQLQLNTSFLSSGIYFYSISDGQKIVSSGKFIKE
jgi:hypothetical protein